jgi:hypothetical protein
MLLIPYLVVTAATAVGLLQAAERISWRALAGTVFGAALAGMLLWSFAASQVPFASSQLRESAIVFCVAALVPGVVAGSIVVPAGPPDWPSGSRRTRRIVAWGLAALLWAVMAPVALFFTACGLDAGCAL